VSFCPDAATVEIHHAMALDLSFICHQPSENDSSGRFITTRSIAWGDLCLYRRRYESPDR